MDQVLTLRLRRRWVPGLTLLELAVTMAIFSLLSAMVFFALQSSRTASDAFAAADKVQRAHLIARLRLAELLRGARLVTPNQEHPESTQISFQRPLFLNGELQVDLLGNVAWSETIEVSLDENGLLKSSSVEEGILARLGTSASFRAQALTNKVRVTLLTPAAGSRPAQESRADFHVLFTP